MDIKQADFVKSAVNEKDYPEALNKMEFAFVGRSNVGKSSLINSLTGRKKLAKTSKTPGRTQLVNFFLINNEFNFVDLPGYGFAKVPMAVKESWGKTMENYLKSERKKLLKEKKKHLKNLWLKTLKVFVLVSFVQKMISS